MKRSILVCFPPQLASMLILPWALALAQPVAPQVRTPVSHGALHVEHNLLVDATGRHIVLRGTQLQEFNRASSTSDVYSGDQFGAFSTQIFSVIRHWWNMNAVRLPVNVADFVGNPGYFAELNKVVQKANSFELLVILAAREPAAGLPSDRVAQFWRHAAAYFKDNPKVIFDVFSEPRAEVIPGHLPGNHPASDWQFWLHGGYTNLGQTASGVQELVGAIRSAGALQPIAVVGLDDVLAPDSFIADPNIIYEASPRFAAIRTDSDRDGQLGFLAGRVPVLANNWDLNLDDDSPDCATLPPDPTAAEKLVEANLAYFDAHAISWTVSVFKPGKLVTDFYDFNTTTLENGWVCGRATSFSAGMGMAVRLHLCGAENRGLYTVNSTTGNFILPRGGFASAYGPILAEQERGAGKPPFPTVLGNVSVRVTDSSGVARLARLQHATAGWGEINFLVPPGSAPGPARISILRSDGSSTAGNATIADFAPGLFTASGGCYGPVIGFVAQKFADGRVQNFPAFKCDGGDRRAVPIELSPKVSTTVRMLGQGFRYLGRAPDVQVRVGGVRVPVLSYGRAQDPGVDEVTIRLMPELAVLGETSVILSVNGEVGNAARIRVQSRAPIVARKEKSIK
jgi:uncharacterized protein (TIGR03437 family)